MISAFKKIKMGAAKEDGVGLPSNEKWEAVKQKLASYLQRKSERLSSQLKRHILIFFCLLFGGSSIATIIHSVTSKDKGLSITKISKPISSIQNEKAYLREDSSITEQEYHKVEQFKTYLFHLKTESLNQYKSDSILRTRPGLIDSINLFEKMYLQQK